MTGRGDARHEPIGHDAVRHEDVRHEGARPDAPAFPSADAYAREPVRHPPLHVVDVQAEQHAIADAYRNLVLGRVDTGAAANCLRLAVFTGEYRWHLHPHSDELFLVVEGRLEVDVEGGRTLALGPWQCVVVPAGTVHRTRAVGRTVNLTVEALGADTLFVDAPPPVPPSAPPP